MDNSIREQTPMGRFEIMCELYLNGNDEKRNTILWPLTPEERQIFLKGVGLYHLFTDEAFFRAVRDAVGQQIWEDAHQSS